MIHHIEEDPSPEEIEKRHERIREISEIIYCKLDGGCIDALPGPECPELFSRSESPPKTCIQQLGISTNIAKLVYNDSGFDIKYKQPKTRIEIQLFKLKSIPNKDVLLKIGGLCEQIINLLGHGIQKE